MEKKLKNLKKLSIFLVVMGVLFLGGKAIEVKAYTLNYSTEAVSTYQGCTALSGYYGKTGYINIWDADRSNTIKKVSYTITKDGQSIKSDSYSANNYMNYCAFPIIIYETGQYVLKVDVTTVSGGSAYGENQFYIYDIMPVVSSNPSAKTVKTGTAVSFSTAISQGTNVKYQWYYSSDGGSTYSAISGATSSTYTIPASSVTSSLNGRYYRCRLSNDNDSGKYVYTTAAKLTVYSAPTVTTPVSKSVTSENSATFIVSASEGNPNNYTYQWYYAESSTGTGIQISGATSSSYTITSSNMKSSLDGRYYYCVVSNGQYDVPSGRAKLTVYYAPTVTAPTDKSVKEGESATFTVSASGGNPSSYSYQWYYAESSTGTGTQISGATSSSYTITSSDMKSSLDGRYYYCVVSNGQYDVPSGRAKLTVQSDETSEANVPPTVSGLIEWYTIASGTSLDLEVNASGGTPDVYTYQWYYAESESGEGTKIDGAVSSKYTIPSLEVTVSINGRYYYCIVSNGAYHVESQRTRVFVYNETDQGPETGEAQKTETGGDQNTGTGESQNTGTGGSQNTGTGGSQNTGTEGNQNSGTGGNQSTGTGGSKAPTASKPVSQKIKVKANSYTKAYGSKPFSIKASTSGNGKLTYQSSDKKVATVSSKGKVTLKGYGTARITIRASKTSTYKAASKQITIKVEPKKPVFKKVNSPESFKISLKWKKDKTVDGYMIYIQDGVNNRIRQKKYPKSKTSVTLFGLDSGKEYYVGICSYVKVGKKTIYSYWREKKVKVK